jgi:hypothetical protein
MSLILFNSTEFCPCRPYPNEEGFADWQRLGSTSTPEQLLVDDAHFGWVVKMSRVYGYRSVCGGDDMVVGKPTREMKSVLSYIDWTV